MNTIKFTSLLYNVNEYYSATVLYCITAQCNRILLLFDYTVQHHSSSITVLYWIVFVCTYSSTCSSTVVIDYIVQ